MHPIFCKSAGGLLLKGTGVFREKVHWPDVVSQAADWYVLLSATVGVNCNIILAHIE